MPTQLEEGTEVYAINEIPTSYSFVRRAIPCGYLPSRLRHSGRYPPVLPWYSLVLGQYFIRTVLESSVVHRVPIQTFASAHCCITRAHCRYRALTRATCNYIVLKNVKIKHISQSFSFRKAGLIFAFQN